MSSQHPQLTGPNRQAPMRTVKDVAKHLNISEREIRRWIASGDLKVHRFGRQVRISDDDFQLFLYRHRG